MEKFVSYIRVSTKKQGASGLGLEAQQKAVTDYLNGGSWELIQEFVEVESGKKNRRPKLQEALNLCKMTGATLVIARLDRLARNVAFTAELMESGIEFVACDNPQATNFTIHILAAVAEQEAEAISKRTKVALAASKVRVAEGLRAPWKAKRQLTATDIEKGRAAAAVTLKENADKFASRVRPMINSLREQGKGLREIARELKSLGVKTAKGGGWTPTAVKNILSRAKEVQRLEVSLYF